MKQWSQKWKQNLRKFLERKVVNMQTKINLKVAGPADKHHLKACDHAQQAVELGLASFV